MHFIRTTVRFRAALAITAVLLLPGACSRTPSVTDAHDLAVAASTQASVSAPSPASAVATASPFVAAAGLSIPLPHPRIWYSATAGSPGAARLARAKAYLASHPVPMDDWRTSTKMMQNALWSLLTGNPGNAGKGCQAAAAWLAGFNFPSSDEARWSGENAILIYDWCHAQIPAETRASLIGKWNTRLAQLNADPWGGVYQPANNYFWGYTRNSLLWGIASYHENPQAQAFIDHALDKRYRNASGTTPPGSAFARWYERFGIGGVYLEGGQYGPYLLGYPVIAFTSAGDHGHDAWSAVPFWRDAAWLLQYATTPARTRKRDGAGLRWEMFPFNDDQFFVDAGSAENTEYADFLGAMILRDPGTDLARQARDWIARTGVAPSWWVGAELAATPVAGAAPALPLDYYAAGAKFLYGRGGTQADATAFLFQLGAVNAYLDTGSPEFFEFGGVGHSQMDAGSFQLWRKARWLSRETTGYGSPDAIKGWNNGPPVDPGEAVAHNAVLFEGRGQIAGDLVRGAPVVLRLHSAPQFAYAAVDLTNAYRANADDPWEMDEDWPFAERVVREFVYLRALDALVVLDRLKSGSASLDPAYAGYGGPHLSAAQVRKSFLLHATGTGGNEAGNPFTLGPGKASAVVGDQRLDLATLVPAAPAYRVVAEGGEVGQFRLEYDVSGAAQSYLLNVVSLRDADDAPLSASLVEDGTQWQLTLSDPTRGSATVVLHKGETSAGGSVAVASATPVALRGDVQAMQVTDQGPVWQGAPAILFGTGGRQRPRRL